MHEKHIDEALDSAHSSARTHATQMFDGSKDFFSDQASSAVNWVSHAITAVASETRLSLTPTPRQVLQVATNQPVAQKQVKVASKTTD